MLHHLTKGVYAIAKVPHHFVNLPAGQVGFNAIKAHRNVGAQAVGAGNVGLNFVFNQQLVGGFVEKHIACERIHNVEHHQIRARASVAVLCFQSANAVAIAQIPLVFERHGVQIHRGGFKKAEAVAVFLQAVAVLEGGKNGLPAVNVVRPAAVAAHVALLVGGIGNEAKIIVFGVQRGFQMRWRYPHAFNVLAVVHIQATKAAFGIGGIKQHAVFVHEGEHLVPGRVDAKTTGNG